jgi:hypothetical protein
MFRLKQYDATLISSRSGEGCSIKQEGRMPNWQPNWNNVRWDWGAANAASSALRHNAVRLDTTAHQRGLVAGEAQAQWRGRYRSEFDVALQGMLQGAYGLAAEMRDAASRIDRASQRAYDEQRHRERERERWRREKEEEDRRRREEEARKRR